MLGAVVPFLFGLAGWVIGGDNEWVATLTASILATFGCMLGLRMLRGRRHPVLIVTISATAGILAAPAIVRALA